MISTEERKELRLAEKRIEELDLLVKGTFEAHVLGNLPDRQFQKLMSDYDAEQQQPFHFLRLLRFCFLCNQ